MVFRCGVITRSAISMCVAGDGLGKRLVHRLVETRNIAEVIQIGDGHAFAPESEYGGAKSTGYSETTSLRLNPEATRPML